MIPEGPTSDAERRSLDGKFAGGLAWTAGVKWTTQAATWGALVIVARLLSKSDYGVGQMAGTMAVVSNVLAEFGVGTAVLHMPELSRKALAQLHTFSVLMCSGVFLLGALASPFVASFYHSAHVTFFVVNNIGLFITGFQAVPMGLLSRDMDYRRLSLAEAAMVLVQSAVTVVTAWLGWGYWALCAGATAGKVTAAVMVCSWKHVGFAWPRWSEVRAPVELGRQTAIGRVAWSLYSQADGIIVGHMLGDSVLGVYTMALNLASAPAEKVSTLLMRTVTPLFANVQFDRALVRRYYKIVTESLTLIVAPLMAGLIIVAHAVPLVLGSKWTPAIAPMRWLAVFMILRTLGTLTEQVLISQRLTRFTMRMSILNFVAMPVAFVLAARWQGMSGVAIAWIALSPVTIFPLLFVLLRHIGMSWREYANAILPAVAGTATMCLALLGVDHWLQSYAWPSSLRLAALVVIGAAVYAGVMLGLFRQRIARYMNFLTSLRKRAAAVPA